MGFDLNIHRVTSITAVATVPPAFSSVGLTVTVLQDGYASREPESVELEVYLSSDQDAADAYALAAAINCSVLGMDELEDRRRRAAMALGWLYVDETPRVKGHWARPIRDGEHSMLAAGRAHLGEAPNELWADDVEEALREDLGAF